MERGHHPRISWKGESIISGIVFIMYKFVLPTQSCNLITREKILMVKLVHAGEPVADLAGDCRGRGVWGGGLLRNQPKPYIIKMQWFFFNTLLCCVPPSYSHSVPLFNFLTTVTQYPLSNISLDHASIASIMYLYIWFFFLSSWLMLCLKVSSIVQETMPATQLTKCCHVDLNCLQERKWFMQRHLFLHLLISLFYMHFAQNESLQ